MKQKYLGIVAAVALALPTLLAEDAKVAADNLQYSRDFYSKVHFVAIANLDFGAGGTAAFKYDRYPNGGPERIQAGDGEFVRKNGKTWVKSNDGGETGKPVDAETTKRLNNWVGLIDGRLNSEPAAKESGEGAPGMKFTDRLVTEFSGPMRLGAREAKVKISFSHLIAVNVQETVQESSSPTPTNAATTTLLDGKLKIDIPADFVRDPEDPKEPKTLAKFSHRDEGGAWGAVLRGTHGLTPEQVDGYLKKRVDEYSKGFKWLPKDSHLLWLRKEIVTIDGRKWADWRYVPMLKGNKDYRNSPVYTRFLTTSYKGQLLEINFTSNLNTEPGLKAEIDRIMDSVHLEE